MGLVPCPRSLGGLELARGHPQHAGGRSTCPDQYPRVPTTPGPTASTVPGRRGPPFLRDSLLLLPLAPQYLPCHWDWSCSISWRCCFQVLVSFDTPPQQSPGLFARGLALVNFHATIILIFSTAEVASSFGCVLLSCRNQSCPYTNVMLHPFIITSSCHIFTMILHKSSNWVFSNDFQASFQAIISGRTATEAKLMRLNL